ncbi:MAG TPA: hypothetical protein VIH31_01720 [Candidatus Paceibacterota bacterium]
MKKLFFIIFALITGAVFKISAQSVAISQIQKLGDQMHVTVVFNNIDPEKLGESLLILQYGPDTKTCCIEEKIVAEGGWQEYMFSIPAENVRYLKAIIFNRYLSLFSNDPVISPLCFVPQIGE